MDPVIIVFVMATGFVALTFVLPLLWFTQGPTAEHSPSRTNRPATSPNYYVKSVPATSRPPIQRPYPAGASAENITPLSYQVKALPGVAAMRTPRSRRLAVAA